MRLRTLRNVVTNLFGAFVVATLSGSCADISLLETGECGNFVIDLGEDCDGHPLEENTTCAAPDKPNACRQVCESVKDCPGGWGCGNDKICRRASGSFTPMGDALPFAPPVVMYSGDFDGDKIGDLLLLGHENALGTRPARIAYARPGAMTVELRTLSESLASPAVTDIDVDGGPLDIAFATLDGISLLRGTRDRSTEYSVFPFYSTPHGAAVRVVPTNILKEFPGDELIAFIDNPNGKTSLNVLTGKSLEPLITVTQNVDSIAGNVGRGRFDQSAACEQLVFAYRGANEVLVYSPCRADGPSGLNVGGTPTAIKLPAGVSVDDGVLAADLDFNGRIDILIGTNTKTHVAWGNGDGTFVSDKANGQMNVAGPYALPAAVEAKPEFPLAVADINADMKIDYVFPQGVLVSGEGGHVFVYKNLGGSWTTAIIADLNANGLDDIIAGSSEAIDLNFLNNAGSGVFNPSTLPTESPISLLAVADFDGDLIRDVAVVQSYLGPSSDSSSTLSIGFGKSHGPPEELVRIGRLGNTTQIVSATISDPDNEATVTDGIADLIAIDQHTVTVEGSTMPVTHSILFRGNGSRVLHTSRPLTYVGGASRPLALAVAQFADGMPEIAALGTDNLTGELSFWTIEGSEADLARPGPALPAGFHALGNKKEVTFRYGAYIATGDLNDDDTDEIVLIAPYGSASDGAAVLIADYDETDDTFVPRAAEAISAVLSVDNRFELHDVDGDGDLDGVLSTGFHEEPGDLIVLWGDGKGKLLTNAPDHVRPEGGVRGFTCIPAEVGCRLVLAAPSGTYLTTVNTGRRLELERIQDLPEASAIAAGDFDGDGVVDIALHSQEGITLYRSLPVLP